MDRKTKYDYAKTSLMLEKMGLHEAAKKLQEDMGEISPGQELTAQYMEELLSDLENSRRPLDPETVAKYVKAETGVDVAPEDVGALPGVLQHPMDHPKYPGWVYYDYNQDPVEIDENLEEKMCPKCKSEPCKCPTKNESKKVSLKGVTKEQLTEAFKLILKRRIEKSRSK